MLSLWHRYVQDLGQETIVQSIFVDGKEIEFVTRPSRRARRLGLTVYPGGRLVVTVPASGDTTKISHFLRQHSVWISKNLRRFANKKKLPGGVKDYRENKKNARKLIEERLEYYNLHYRFSYGRVSIRDSRSRWGSCSRKGNLNFSYKLVYLPPRVRDYVVVHELAHLRYFNHSTAFWATVAETIPEHVALRKELRSFVH